MRHRRIATILLGLTVPIVALAGCNQNTPANWRQLCEQVDCSNYPLGYDSIVLDASHSDSKTWNEPDFYFPVAENFRRDQRWVERDADGNPLRTLTVRDNDSSGNWEFERFALKRIGAAGEWPPDLDSHFALTIFANGRPEFRRWMGDWKYPLRASDYSWEERQRIAADLAAALPSLLSRKGEFESVSSNFRLVYTLPADATAEGKLRFGVFSTAPMLQGMYLLGICDPDYCRFLSVPNGENPSPPYLYEVSWYFGEGLGMLPASSTRAFPYASLDRGLALLDRVIEASRQKPAG